MFINYIYFIFFPFIVQKMSAIQSKHMRRVNTDYSQNIDTVKFVLSQSYLVYLNKNL